MPLKSYWALVSVLFDEPVTFADTGERIRGYYVNIGFSCQPDDIRTTLEYAINDGMIDWADTDIEERERAEVEDEILQTRINHDKLEGVWYRSGRSLFP